MRIQFLDDKTAELMQGVLTQQTLFQQYLTFLYRILREMGSKGHQQHLHPLWQELQNLSAAPGRRMADAQGAA